MSYVLRPRGSFRCPLASFVSYVHTGLFDAHLCLTSRLVSLMPSCVLHLRWSLQCLLVSYVHAGLSDAHLCLTSWMVSSMPTCVLHLGWSLRCPLVSYVQAGLFDAHSCLTSTLVSLMPTCVLRLLGSLQCPLVSYVHAGLFNTHSCLTSTLVSLVLTFCSDGRFVLSVVSPAVVVPSMLGLSDRGYGLDKGIPTLIVAAVSLDAVLAITGFGVCLGITFTSGRP